MVVLGPELLRLRPGTVFSVRVQLQQDSGDTAEGEGTSQECGQDPVRHLRPSGFHRATETAT